MRQPATLKTVIPAIIINIRKHSLQQLPMQKLNSLLEGSHVESKEITCSYIVINIGAYMIKKILRTFLIGIPHLQWSRVYGICSVVSLGHVADTFPAADDGVTDYASLGDLFFLVPPTCAPNNVVKTRSGRLDHMSRQ